MGCDGCKKRRIKFQQNLARLQGDLEGVEVVGDTRGTRQKRIDARTERIKQRNLRNEKLNK